MHLLRHRIAPFLVCLLLVVAGCQAWRQASAASSFRFNHVLHQSVECADCHGDAATGAKAGMPKPDTCTDCHEGIDAKKGPDRQVATLFVDGTFKAANVTAIPAEVIFSHKTHTVDNKVACATCHQGIADSTVITKEVRVDMSACMACHATSPKPSVAANACATCHQTIRADAKPATHAQNWKRFHGQTFKDGDQTGLNQCSLCHTQDRCDTCHRAEAPTNHTNLWRQRTHGAAAAIDRSSCATCHQSDSCASCHKTTAPSTHRGQWGAPIDKHCVNCHVPVSGESCAVCHQNGTPSHAKAVATPVTMIGTDCRSCHGVAPNAKLPHVDNGDNCTYCHQ
ncbi:MAG: cytochrome c3 family protein [Planctomycetota bacterium]